MNLPTLKSEIARFVAAIRITTEAALKRRYSEYPARMVASAIRELVAEKKLSFD